jgi:hypothetical protein
MKRVHIISCVFVLALVAASIAFLSSVTTALAAPLTPVPQTTTRLLFPFVTNQSGFDTGIAISNTGRDSTGVVGRMGNCKIIFFGPTGIVATTMTGVLTPGQTFTGLVSVLQPGFQGYIEVDCDFPFAHGWGFVSDLGARNFAASSPALVLPTVRDAQVESAGQ